MPIEETRRLAEVYDDYAADPRTASRWDAANPGNRANAAARHRHFRHAFQTHAQRPLAECVVLDIGCGDGAMLAKCTEWGVSSPHLIGVDLLPHRLFEARELFPDLRLVCANGEYLPFADATFDAVIASTIFSSILDPRMAAAVAGEMARVLRPGGIVLWYDLRIGNPRNPHVRRLTRADLRRLFPRFEVRVRSATLLPPLARRLGPLTPIVLPMLTRLCPPLRTHFVGVLVKPATVD